MKKRALYFIIILLIPYTVWSQADTNLTYASQTGTSGTKYSWIDSGAGSSSALVSNIATLNPNRATLVAGNNGPVCQGGTLSLTATTVAGATYSWTGPNGYTSNLQNPTVSTKALPSMSGLYSVTTTVGGIPSVATTNVTVVGISQIPAGAILNYKFNGNANDEANTNNGTLQKSPTPTPDRFNLINSAYSFNGTTQYVSTANQYTNPTNFTISIWFKTNTTTGGKLIGFGSLKTGSSGSNDRHLYMNNAGQIYFGVFPNAVVTVNSPLSYNDDIWHLATATLSSTSGMTLYIDGQQVAYNSNTLAESYNGYWRIGYDNNNGWTSQPSSYFFNGTLDDALVYPTALSSTQVSALYSSPDGAGNYGYACVGSNLDLTATTISGATYSWTGPNGFNSSSQNPSFIYSSAYKGVYTVQVSSGACSSVAYTAVSSVEITGTTPGSRKGTGTVVLGATASFGTVNWYSTATGGASLGTGTTFTTPSISITTTYYVDATYNGCTSSPRTAVVATIVSGPAASWNYGTQTGNLNTTYSWIDCKTGSNIVSGDDAQATINWPFNFSFYDNNYTTADNLSLSTNGFIRLDGDAGTNYSAASAYTLSSNSIELGQIIAMGVYDNKVGDNSGWVRSLVTGTAPNRIFTIEYNNLEIDYNDAKYADVQVSFYEASNKIVLKLGTHNVTLPGADMGLHSGVETFFNKWQEVNSGTKDTWIEYTPPYIEVNATTGTPVAFYSTLKDAFDKVNNGTHKGNITIKINHSTTETAPAVLNASGTGGSNYSAINIYPTETGFSVSGDLASPLIDLNGADNVTIDGRVNATGTTSDLTINNTSTSATAGASTVRFINDATNNTIKYCNIKGSETASNSGILFFSTTTSSIGNDGNIISNNNITSSIAGNRPANGIYSAGTNGKENSGNTISNNNIYDFLRKSAASSGILLSAYSTAWTIDGNSFYETFSFIPNGSVVYNAIQIDNTSGNDFIIKNNYIGGSAAQCGGTAWTKSSVTNNVFNAINLNIGTATASSVQNNIIKNFSWSNSSYASWTAIAIAGGNVNIGTVAGNTIGAETGTGSITVTGSTSGLLFVGINITGGGIVDCQNNKIGSITTANEVSNASNIAAIYKSGAGTTTISNNILGSIATSNSLFASSASTGAEQYLYGVCNVGTGTISISGNTIANITNGTTNTSISTIGLVHGIYSENGTNTIYNNTIHDLTIANANNNSLNQPSVGGIILNGTGTVRNISGNKIYNLSNTYASFAGNIIGIYFTGSAAASNTIDRNFIHSLSAEAGTIYGIKIESGKSIYANNIISLSSTKPNRVIGIYDAAAASQNSSLYFNTIHIGGTASTGTLNSYDLYINASAGTRDYRNNIFSNARTNPEGTGKHYGIYYNATGVTFTADYNDYYVSGTGGIIGYYTGDNNTLALLQTATGQDAHSLNTNPNFAAAGGSNPLDYKSSVALLGVAGTGIITDYEGITRNNPPQMGALETTQTFIWQGGTSTDFATASNWVNGTVPPNGADVSFAATPANDCYLDQSRTLKNITNAQSLKKLVVNGKQLTITGDLIFSNDAQVDATAASSTIIFEGTGVQSFPSSVFVNNTVNALTLNNSNGLNQNGDLIVSAELSLINGIYSIGANTLTINGALSTASGSLMGGSTSNLVVGGSGATATLPALLLNNLTLNRPNGISLGGSLSIEGTLALTAGTLTVGANTLTISGNAPTRTSGNIDASNAAATMVFSSSTAITLAESLFTGSINNLSINGAGITACGDIAVNGILNLQSGNPSDVKGAFDMVTYTLLMGAFATTTGTGDVTGQIKRTTILAEVEYTFGNQFSSVTFPNIGTLPTELTLKVSIGTAPTWKPDGLKRIYDIKQIGGVDTKAVLKSHYLDSELNGNIEINISHFSYVIPSSTLLDRGVTELNTTDNWITLNNTNFTNLPSVFGAIEHSFGVSTSNVITWDGSESTDWTDPYNWTPNESPAANKIVIIPNATTTPNDPIIANSSSTTVKTLSIQAGGILYAGTASELTVVGASGAWSNYGTFNPSTGKVIFDNGVVGDIVTIAGTTNFYNIEVGANTTMQPTAGSVLRIAGSGIATATSMVDFSTVDNTVEWNGANQTIVNPIGIGSNSGFYNLILSGSGTKTMPSTAMSIQGDLIIDGTASVTAASALTIGRKLDIFEGATFATGNYDHTIGGNFDNLGTFTASAGTKITLNGTAAQNIFSNTDIAFEKLTINNAAGVDVYTDFTVNDILDLNTGNLNLGESTLTINSEITKTAGFINTTALSSLNFGGTTAISLASDLFYTSPPSFNNLTINRGGGVIFGSDITVNGVLNLLSANPTAFLGSLDMGAFTLLMEASATTAGTGDVTGQVKRTTILPNIEYTFGSQFSSVTFPDIGILPTELALKISIGTAPAWKPDGLKRIYDIIQIGGSGTRAVLKSHYLDSELNDNIEINISHFSCVIQSSTLLDRGVTELNTTDNWITLNNTNFTNLPSDFGVIEHSFGVSTSNVITWDGSESTDWTNQYNWTPAHSPDATKIVIIPDAATTPNDPFIANSSSTTVKTLSIQPGGILNAGSASQLTVVGASGAWSNNGTFNASTGKVIFNNDVAGEVVTIAGTTNFYNIEVGENTTMQPTAGSVLRIAGSGIATATSVVDFSTVDNTVEWNGGNQTIVNPIGIGSNSGFYNLILSGSGTKTMPSSALSVLGNFTTSGTASATAAESIIVLGNTTIEIGSTFATGNHNHLLGGNFENNGTFTPTSGGTITFNGTSAQTISGTSTSSFDNLIIDNQAGVNQESMINVNNVLTFNNGNLRVGATTLGINGTVNNLSGNIDVVSTSSLSFGGTSAFTLNNNLFNANPTINNLTVNRIGGVTLGNESITVNGTLTLTSGTLAIADNTLTLAGNSPLRTSGYLNASHPSAYLAFENAVAIALPASFFSGNVNNMTINGAGGVTAGGDFTLDGILYLKSANPSSTKGSLDMSSNTLTMGAISTTVGQGDVSGIIKRIEPAANTTYTMGNQYTTIYFPAVGTLPTEMSVKVSLGAAPAWSLGAVERVYDFIQTDGSGTEAVLKSHYLESELNGNDENKLVQYMHVYAVPTTIEYGRSDYNTIENWVSVSHVNVGVFSDVFGAKELALARYQLANLTWNGSISTSWITAANWTPQGAPSDETVITIPDAATTPNDPFIPETGICGKVIIASGGILNSVVDGQLTVMGASDAWDNNGTFAPGKGTVIFANGDDTKTVTISGTSSFYNLTVSDGTNVQAKTNTIINIEGTFSANPGNSILDFSSNPNTIGYSGNQTQDVINPGGEYGYHSLNLSGDGVKILPESSLIILGDLTINAAISATGNTILMAGTSTQNVAGATASTLNNLTIDNAIGVVLTNTAVTTVSGSLQINSGKKFEVAAAQKLTVTGSITNSAGNGGLILKSDATGTASLIHSDEDIAATVERYISGAAEDWHFMASPVASQSFSTDWLPTGTYGNGTGYDLYVWDEPTSCWIYKLNTTSLVNWNTVHPGANFMAGRGYLYSVQAASPTKSFAGNLNTGDLTYGLTINSIDLLLQGFNFVGNPYASSIDWKAASGWTRSNLVETIGEGYNMWIWDPAANNYGVYNSADPDGEGTNSITSNIASMQGFFVEAKTAGDLGFSNAIRVHDGAGNWFKNQQNQTNNLNMLVSSDAGFGSDEIQLEFGFPEKAEGAKKLFSHVKTSPALYMPVSQQELTIGYFTTPDETIMVPVSFTPGKDGNFTVRYQFDSESFDLVWLEDKRENYYMDIKLTPEYRFSSKVTDDANRFVLHFAPDSHSVNELPAHIFYNGNDITIDLSLIDENVEVKVVDMLGRVVLQKNLEGKATRNLPIIGKNQVYMVYAATKNAFVAVKVFVH